MWTRRHQSNCCIQSKRDILKENVQRFKTSGVFRLTNVVKNSSADINCFQQRAAGCLISSVSTNISRTRELAERHSRLTSCCKMSDHIPELPLFPVRFCFLPEIKEEEVLGCTCYSSLLLKSLIFFIVKTKTCLKESLRLRSLK
jgi:hypothetical protein